MSRLQWTPTPLGAFVGQRGALANVQNVAGPSVRNPIYSRYQDIAPPATAGDATYPVSSGNMTVSAPTRRSTAPTMAPSPIPDPNRVAYQNPVAAGNRADAMSKQADITRQVAPNTAPDTPNAPKSSMMSVQDAKKIWDDVHGPQSFNAYEGYAPEAKFRQIMGQYGIGPEDADRLHQHFSSMAENPSPQMLTPEQRQFVQNAPDQPSAAAAASPFAPGKSVPGFTDTGMANPRDVKPGPNAPVPLAPDAEPTYNRSNQINRDRNASVADLDRRASRINQNLAPPVQPVDPRVAVANAKAAGDLAVAQERNKAPALTPYQQEQIKLGQQRNDNADATEKGRAARSDQNDERSQLRDYNTRNDKYNENIAALGNSLMPGLQTEFPKTPNWNGSQRSKDLQAKAKERAIALLGAAPEHPMMRGKPTTQPGQDESPAAPEQRQPVAPQPTTQPGQAHKPMPGVAPVPKNGKLYAKHTDGLWYPVE